METLKIRLIEEDSLDEQNHYYLYEVETDTEHYYVTSSDEDIKKNKGMTDLINGYNQMCKDDFTEREWEIAQYLFSFLWDSSNGTNTEVESDIYEEDGFNQDEVINFVEKFNKEQPREVLDVYEDGGVEIYWDYFSCFDLTKSHPLDN